jgi:CBS domain containing-hemolysin-like protein
MKKRIIDISTISQTESRMIDEILAMKKREVHKVMVPTNEIVALSYDQTLYDAIKCFQQYYYSRYPVYFSNLDQIVGVLYIKDVLAFWHEYRNYPVIEFVRFPHFIYEDRSAFDVFLELQRLRFSLGIVIDEFGGVSGIITTEDLIEEIVGDIEDEFDKRKKSFIEKVSANEYIVNTRMELDDFVEYFKIRTDEDDISTVGGLIVKTADRIPKVGEEIKYKKLTFKILEATKRRITRVKVTKK